MENEQLNYSSVNFDVEKWANFVLPYKLVTPFKSFGFKGSIYHTTFSQLRDWLLNEKHWAIAIVPDKNNFTYNVESTEENGIEFLGKAAVNEKGAVIGAIEMAAMACQAVEGSDYYFPED